MVVAREEFLCVLNGVDDDLVVLLQPDDELVVADGVGQVADTHVGGLAEQILSLVRRVLHLEPNRQVACVAVGTSSSRKAGRFTTDDSSGGARRNVSVTAAVAVLAVSWTVF